MTQASRRSSAIQTISQRVKELRERRGWSARELAEACARQGMPGLGRNVLANLESGRRPMVSVDEFLTLAYLLDVAPVHLLVPTDPEDARYRITGDVSLSPWEAREWVRGRFCPPGGDLRNFYSNVPREEFQTESPTLVEIDPRVRPSGRVQELTSGEET